MMKGFVVGCVVLTLVFVLACPARSTEEISNEYRFYNRPAPTGEAVIGDTLVARPAGIAVCAVGLVASVIALPFALISNSQSNVYESLIATPFRFTFKRPVGEWGYEWAR